VHIYTLIKVKADDADEARSIVEGELDNSIENGRAGFDYVGGIMQVVETVTDSNTQVDLGGLNSFEELEKHWKKSTLNNLKNFKGDIHDRLFVGLAEFLLPPDEAPLYLNKKNHYNLPMEDFNKIRDKILKEGKKKELTYEQIITKITKFMTEKADSMFSFYLQNVKELKNHLEYPEDKYAALYNSNDVHFADLSLCQEEEGIPDDLEIFYFLCDRHC